MGHGRVATGPLRKQSTCRLAPLAAAASWGVVVVSSRCILAQQAQHCERGCIGAMATAMAMAMAIAWER